MLGAMHASLQIANFLFELAHAAAEYPLRTALKQHQQRPGFMVASTGSSLHAEKRSPWPPPPRAQVLGFGRIENNYISYKIYILFIRFI